MINFEAKMVEILPKEVFTYIWLDIVFARRVATIQISLTPNAQAEYKSFMRWHSSTDKKARPLPHTLSLKNSLQDSL